MKKIYFLVVICIALTVKTNAQAIVCNQICVLSMSLDTIQNELNVTIVNGANGAQINYPIVVVTDSNGDTIANKNHQFFLFAQLTDDTVIHSLPSALNLFAANFTGTVYVKAATDSSVCAFAYPMTCTVGINELAQSNFLLFPNPATDNITVDLNNFNFQKANLFLYDVFGKKIQQLETSSSKTIINTEILKAGIYFVAVSVNNKMYTRKLVIQ